MPNTICVPKNTEGKGLYAVPMITQINKTKTAKNYISCDCKCKYHGTKSNLNQKWNKKYVDMSEKSNKPWPLGKNMFRVVVLVLLRMISI